MQEVQGEQASSAVYVSRTPSVCEQARRQLPPGGSSIKSFLPTPSGCRATNKGHERRFCGGFLPRKRKFKGTLCNQSRQTKQPLAQAAKGHEGVRGSAVFALPPAALRRFRRAKAASHPLHHAATRKQQRASNARPYGQWGASAPADRREVQAARRAPSLPYGYGVTPAGNVSGNILSFRHNSQNTGGICSTFIHNAWNFLPPRPLKFKAKSGILSPYQEVPRRHGGAIENEVC